MDRRAAKPSRRPSRRALAAALLLAPSMAAESPASFLNGRYDPSPGVSDLDALAALDLDLRSIEALLAGGTEADMDQALKIYTGGRIDKEATDNVTLQGLSTQMEDLIVVGSQTYAAFKDYYGSAYYADNWVKSSFEGIDTAFAKGNYDFNEFAIYGRAAAVQYGTLVLNVWMSVVGRVEEAANLCLSKADEDLILVDEWDRAVALYTGSRARESGTRGNMLYTLAETECAAFGTCAPGEMGPVNDRIFDAFNDGKAHLQQGNCHDVLEKANDIKSLMTVPLIQGTLRAMHALDKSGQVEDEDAQGRGAAFSAALLPLVDGCGPGNAQMLHNDLSPGKILTGDYDVVRAALERSYQCLGVTCADVGGILDAEGNGYAKGAEACRDVRPVNGDVDYDYAKTSGKTSDDGEDDLFLYEDYTYFEGKNPFPNYDPNERVGTGNSHTGARMEPARAALISGLSFGIFGMFGGAAVTLACYARKKTKKNKEEHSKVEFVASRNGNGTGNGEVDEDEIL